MVVVLDTFNHPPHKMTTEVDGSWASRGSPRQGRSGTGYPHLLC